jgi:hypothetical protein
MVAGPAHDSALDQAVKEISPLFKQCTRCGMWVCEPVCWNKKAGLCESCAPDLDEEISAAQAMAARQQAIEKAQQVDYLGQRNLEQVVAALCPSCGAKTQGGKFCPECGQAVSLKRTCAQCGAEADGSPKFCPECGRHSGLSDSRAATGPASFALATRLGRVRSGDAEAVISDDALSVRPVILFLDADLSRPTTNRLDLWPAGQLVLTQLGRRFDTFTQELRRSQPGAWPARSRVTMPGSSAQCSAGRPLPPSSRCTRPT